MALKLSKPKPAEATQTTEHSTKGQLTSSSTENVSTSDLHTMQVATLQPIADIGFTLSYTHNLGDFKSTRVEVSLKLPVPMDELEEGYTKAKEWVEGKLQPIVSELLDSN